MPGIETAPEVSEVLAEGQGVDLGLRVGDVIWSIDGERVLNRDDLRDKLAALGDRDSFPAVIRRYVRDDDGRPLAKRNADGDLLLNAAGETEWDVEEFTVTMTPGKLGLRIGDGGIVPKPYR